MMKIQWTDQEIKWFHAAAEYTTYNKELAELILKYVGSGGSLCDIGCGVGLVDLELAPYFSQITCVDIGKKAIESIKKDVGCQGITNIDAICQDGKTLNGKWDTILTIFHGGKDIFDNYFRYVKDRLILITHDKSSERFGHKEEYEYWYSATGTKEKLDEQGVVYKMFTAELEHGQPFTDLEDAKRFFEHYVKFKTEEETLVYMKKHLVETGNEKYPYYQPKMKKFVMFIIRRDQNERFG